MPYTAENLQPSYARGLIDMGIQNGYNAHDVCPIGSDLPVIRSKEQLQKIEGYIGVGVNGKLMTKFTGIDGNEYQGLCVSENFWLNGHLDSACVSESTCEVNNLLWEDNGPAMDESFYEGWLLVNIDNRNLSCVWVGSTNQMNCKQCMIDNVVCQ